MKQSLLTPEQQEILATKLNQVVQFKGHRIVGCDCTLKQTRQILKGLSITGGCLEAVIKEINDGGGYCDCEVLMNYMSSQYSHLEDDMEGVFTEEE